MPLQAPHKLGLGVGDFLFSSFFLCSRPKPIKIFSVHPDVSGPVPGYRLLALRTPENFAFPSYMMLNLVLTHY